MKQDTKLKDGTADRAAAAQLKCWEDDQAMKLSQVVKFLGDAKIDKLLEEYASSSGFHAHDFQKRIALAAVQKCVVDDAAALIELSTGGGKTIIVHLMAHLFLSTSKVDKVIVVSPNAYLTMFGAAKYAHKSAGLDAVPPDFDEKNRIIHITAEAFHTIESCDLADHAVIFDEMDACLLEKRCVIKDNNDGTHTFHYVAKKLSLPMYVVGLSGTFTSDALAAVRSIFGKRASAFASINPMGEARKYTLEAVKVFAMGRTFRSQANRWVKERVSAKITKGNVIVIDGEWKSPMKSFLAAADEPWSSDVVQFPKFDADTFADTSTAVQELALPSPRFRVLHVSLEGIRGVDFAMEDNAHVIVLHDISGLSEFRQACGRGARKFHSPCTADLVVSSASFVQESWVEDIEARLASLAPYEVMQDAVKARICGTLDGQVIRGATLENVVEAEKVLNHPDYAVHAAVGATNFESAKTNYAIVRELFQDALAEDLQKDQNKLIFGKKKF